MTTKAKEMSTQQMIDRIKKLKEIRMVDATLGQINELSRLTALLDEQPEKMYVSVKERNIIFGCESTKAAKIMNWGKANGFEPRAGKKRKFNRKVLIELLEAYIKAH